MPIPPTAFVISSKRDGEIRRRLQGPGVVASLSDDEWVLGDIQSYWAHFCRDEQIGVQCGNSDDEVIIEWESAAAGRGGYMYIRAKTPGQNEESVRVLLLTMELR